MCTGADREDRGRGGKNPVPGAPSRAASRPLRIRRPPGERAGGRVVLEACLCQEESLPGHRRSPDGAMRRMYARSPAGGISRTRAAAAALAAQPRVSAEDSPRPRHAPDTPPPPAERSPWQRNYRRRVLFILRPVPGNSAGRLPGAPPWGGGREREERGWTGAPGAPGRREGGREGGSPSSLGVTDPSEGRLLRNP